jgi:hypothetical protein
MKYRFSYVDNKTSATELNDAEETKACAFKFSFFHLLNIFYFAYIDTVKQQL